MGYGMILFEDKKIATARDFEEFKSSDATSHRFEGPSQYLNAKTSGAGK